MAARLPAGSGVGSGLRTAGPAPWWRSGVLYQIYPRSFADSNADGIGDLPGLIDRLDHLEWLGVDGIWLNPIMPSPNDDWGYDVADYCAVHPELGDLDDVDRLVTEARRRGISVLFDLVPNHTSDRHPWFVESRSAHHSPRRDFYVWADPRPDGSPPNNWLSAFGGPAWTLEEASGQYYLHNFLPSQPDLNWWNEEVREAFDAILRYWYRRGIAGFRIDVAHALVKDRELRDNPPATEHDHPEVRRLGQRQRFNMNRPEVHDVLRRWRRLSEAEDPARVLLGETHVFDLDEWAAFYGSGEDELHLAFNFLFLHAPFCASALRAVVEGSESLLPPTAWPVWTGSNHDAGRLATRWAQGEEAKVRLALMMLLTLRGTPVLYYGDEIGLPEVAVGPERARDVRPGAEAAEEGRDPARTPMHWTSDPGAGFAAATAGPWLPLGDYGSVNVAAQTDDPGSVLRLCRDLIALRRSVFELRTGAYETVPSPPHTWVWRRGARITVALNLSGTGSRVAGVAGVVRLSTRRDRDGQRLRETVELEPWEGVIVEGG